MRGKQQTVKQSKYIHLRRVEFVVTWQCTGRCIHCSAAEQLNPSFGEKHIRTEEATRALRWLCGQFDISSVMTFGGEALLYPEVTCAIHETARACGVPVRQLITNGFFSKKEQQIESAVQRILQSGINDLLLSADAFHQQHIPLEPVLSFARKVREKGENCIRLSPAWLIDSSDKNAFNQKTREILSAFEESGIPVSQGNVVFPAGSAEKYLADYFPEPCLDITETCGGMPYTEPLDQITSLSINPNGDVIACAFPIGNIYRQSMEEIIEGYDPYAHPVMGVILKEGFLGLLRLAEEQGIDAKKQRCRGICGVCHAVSQKLCYD